MNTLTSPDGGAWLAATVRSLAGDVRRLATQGGAPRFERAAIEGRLRQLRERSRHLPPSPLQRWMDSLERELELLN